MTEKKQGKRSSEVAQQTRSHILETASKMFAQLGYERVSIRKLSDKAGISHSLIRHHFGSKENIWREICDAVDIDMKNYITATIKTLPTDKSAKVRIYTLLVKLEAFLLLNPQPIQMIADAIRLDDNALFDYFLKSKSEFEAIFISFFDDYNIENPNDKLDMWETKWLLMVFAQGATSLSPMMAETWPNIANNKDHLLLNHWRLFNEMIAAKFMVPKNELIEISSLNQLLLDIPSSILTIKMLSQSL